MVLLLAACGPFAPRSLPIGVDEDSVIGVWVDDSDGSSSGAMLEIRTDGTFSYEDLPAEIADSDAWATGPGCNEIIAASEDLRGGEGTWELSDSRIMLNFPGAFTWAYPTGFLSFDRIEFICDIDHAGSYALDRTE